MTLATTAIAPDMLSAAQWDRLFGGELYAPLSRVDCATFLRRIFDVDVERRQRPVAA